MLCVSSRTSSASTTERTVLCTTRRSGSLWSSDRFITQLILLHHAQSFICLLHKYVFHKGDYCLLEKPRVRDCVELISSVCPGDANTQSQPRWPGAADGVLQPDVLHGPALLPPAQEPGSALSLVGSSGNSCGGLTAAT